MSGRDTNDEFYVGYLPRAPRGIAARTRLAVAMALALGLAVSFALLRGQAPFAPGRFEFGVEREFVGIARERPYPLLLVPRPGHDGVPPLSSYLTVAFGKFGAQRELAGRDGRAVRLRGTLIYREGRTMIEIARGSVVDLEGDEAARLAALARPETEDLGQVVLVGEIVDSKCFWGVMKPGNLKPHRACAARCISGGVPPLFVVTDAEGRTTQFLLTGPGGVGVNRHVLDRVAEPIEIQGHIRRQGDLLLLEAEMGTFSIPSFRGQE